jgi:DNA (cytosine-5)-methyltransferase 1
MKAAKPTVIDLFAGAGLFSGAFKSQGFELIQAVEIDKIAVETYQQNLGGHIECGDASVLTPKSKCDVLIGGPPCQGFSTLGKRDASDPRNRLCMEMVRWAELAQPKVVVVENVEAFLRSSQCQQMKEGFLAAGYKVTEAVVNASDLGVPQHRKRSFVIAAKSRPIELAPKKRNTKTVRTAWRNLPSEPNGVNLHVLTQPSELALARMRVIPPGGDKRDILVAQPDLAPPSWFKVTREVTDVWGRIHWDRPSNTLRTSLLNPSKGRYIHPEQNRVITLREAARLQSIPDRWKFTGLPTQVARQIGNSVPPGLGRFVAKTVMTHLSNGSVASR